MLAGCAQANIVVDPANIAGMTDMTGMIDARRLNTPENWRSDLTNPDTGVNMDMTHPERSRLPDRFANDRLAGRYMACQRVDNSDMEFAMLEVTSSECIFTHAITAGDLNGDGRDDALVFNGTYNSTTRMYTFEYMSVVGGDGTELWGQSSVYDGWWDDIPAVPVDDLDGDGKRDVIVISRSYNSTTDECTASVEVRRGYEETSSGARVSQATVIMRTCGLTRAMILMVMVRMM